MKALVGNKIDLEDQRQVSFDEGRELAEANKMQYFETSAKLDKNVHELIEYMMAQVYEKMFGAGAQGSEATGRDTTNTVVINNKNT